MKYTLVFVDANGTDLQEKHYEFEDLKEAKEHAVKLLAVDMMGTHHIEVTSEDWEVFREKVFY